MRDNLERVAAPDGQRFILRDPETGDIWYCRPTLACERADMLALMERWRATSERREEGSHAS